MSFLSNKKKIASKYIISPRNIFYFGLKPRKKHIKLFENSQIIIWLILRWMITEKFMWKNLEKWKYFLKA